MATGNDGSTQPPLPPPPPPGGRRHHRPTAPPPVGRPAAQTTKLPVWSFIFGLASFIQCLPLIGGIVAIVTGVMGRKRAKQLNQSSGLATAGIVLGILGLIIGLIVTIILISTGFALFGAVVNQTNAAKELKPAEVAAQAYGAANGAYAGLSIDALSTYGFTPSGDVIMKAVPTNKGTAFCIQSATTANPDSIIHAPPVVATPLSTSTSMASRTGTGLVNAGSIRLTKRRTKVPALAYPRGHLRFSTRKCGKFENSSNL